MKYTFISLLLITVLSCQSPNTPILKPVELIFIGALNVNDLNGLRSISKLESEYIIVTYNPSSIQLINESTSLRTQYQSGESTEFSNHPQAVLIVNDTVYVLETNSRFVNRYDLNIRPIDRILLPNSVPNAHTWNLYQDSLFVITSLELQDSGFHVIDKDFKSSNHVDLSQEIGHVLWDIKYISTIGNEIVIGYPFSGRVEVRTIDGTLTSEFDTGTHLLNIKIPTKNIASPNLSYLSIQALKENIIMFLTPQINNEYHNLYFTDFAGEIIGIGTLNGKFQFINVIEDRIYGFNHDTKNIEIYEVLIP